MSAGEKKKLRQVSAGVEKFFGWCWQVSPNVSAGVMLRYADTHEQWVCSLKIWMQPRHADCAAKDCHRLHRNGNATPQTTGNSLRGWVLPIGAARRGSESLLHRSQAPVLPGKAPAVSGQAPVVPRQATVLLGQAPVVPGLAFVSCRLHFWDEGGAKDKKRQSDAV